MASKSRKKTIRKRDCVCVSLEHCCETAEAFLLRTTREYADVMQTDWQDFARRWNAGELTVPTVAENVDNKGVSQ